jgi:hypothetical protein
MFFQRHRIPQYLDHHCPHVRHQATPRPRLVRKVSVNQPQPSRSANRDTCHGQIVAQVRLSTAPIDGGSNRFSRGKPEHFPRPSVRQGAFHRSCRVPPTTMIVMWRRCRSAPPPKARAESGVLRTASGVRWHGCWQHRVGKMDVGDSSNDHTKSYRAAAIAG